MSGQSHSCDPRKAASDRNRFLAYGALSIALAVGFGYSMAASKYQGAFITIAEVAAKERTSIHRRYMRQLNAKDKELAELRAVINKEAVK